VNRVLNPWIQLHGGQKSLLIMDDFGGHWVEPVSERLKECNIDTLCVPKGYTAKLQVLDVGINKPFHDYTMDLIDEWVIDNYD
jgi:hypothetical protein